ncbi:MAG TPA: histidine phosphatase family protein [Euzebyales bacterium]
MRMLYVLRHAKSSWDDPTLADHERPLAPRGTRAAPLIGDHLRRVGIAPQVVLCSSSRRTRQTLDMLGDVVAHDGEVSIEDDLYHATAATLLRRLRVVPDAASDVLMIGHNPALQQLVLMLAASGGSRAQVARKFPTAALATLRAAVDRWADLDVGRARLTGFVRPKDLGTGV